MMVMVLMMINCTKPTAARSYSARLE